MPRLHRVLYCSRPSRPAPAGDIIDAMLRTARRRNQVDGITGGLLFSVNCFAQVLEGPIDAVTETFERIQQDDRHRDVTVLRAEPILLRDFPTWSMAFSGAGGGDAALRLARLAAPGPGFGGQEMLDLLRAIIVREDDRLPA